MLKKYTIKEWPEEDRPREKLIRKGSKHLTDAELLAIILRTGNKGSVLDLARELLLKFKNLQGIKDASLQELSAVKGVGPAKVAAIMSAFELGSRPNVSSSMSKYTVTRSDDVFTKYNNHFKGIKKEIFITLMLNAKNHVIEESEISVGTLTSNLVHPREVFNPAIRASAASIILIHNHPSGEPEPSMEDKLLTKRIKETGQIVGISVLDHIIIGNDKYFSFLDEGIF